MKSPEEIFTETVKGTNVMTPKVLRYGEAGKYIYELSHGTGLGNQPIWGVTVICLPYPQAEATRRCELSHCFQSLFAAERHIELLTEVSSEP